MCTQHQTAVEKPTLIDLSKMDRREMLRGIATGSILVVAGCATNPVTGRSQLILVDDSSLAQMSLSAWSQLKAKTPISRDPALNARLARVGQRIAGASGARANWEFVVFDTPEKNAFVLPGGKVGYYRGLMAITNTDDMMATVVGHEVAHVTARHAAERYSQQIAAQGLSIAGAVALSDSRYRNAGMAALGLGLTVGVLLPYSRLQESEADRVGVDYMHRAGYDVRQSLLVWQRMAQSGGNRPPTFLSTHPDPIGRQQALRQYINARGYAVV